jgi:hypothetical protein
MSYIESCTDDGVTWCLLYTKHRAEAWVDANLRTQGFACLLPWTPTRAGVGPLFPRYVFAGHHPGQRAEPLASTYGVQYVVHFADQPARVPPEVIEEIRARMDARGIVRLERVPDVDPMFARRERERVYALARLAAAGFRVRVA